MSASIPDPAEEETELLAAEYALGTLDAADHAAASREAAGNPALARAIAAWERRLAPLQDLAAPAAPPADLWPRIEASAWGEAVRQAAAPPAPAGVRPATTRLRFWQGATAAGFALAAGLAGFAVLRGPPPPAAPAPGLLTALLPLSQPPGAPVFVAELAADGALRVSPASPVQVAPGRDLELWLLRDGETVPRPLGLLPPQGVRLAAGSLHERGLPAPGGAARLGAKILVSLEPRGGSPTGLPTGPVLWGGSI